MTRARSAPIFATIAAGVFTGASRPYQMSTSKPAMPLSITVGTPGTCALRVAVVTASGRKRPSLMKASYADAAPNETCTSLASKPVTDGPEPL